MNLPTFLTFFRIMLIPVLVVVYYLPFHYSYIATAFIFILACLTDWLDGYLARTLMQESAFGEFLDPVADKLVVAIALILIVSDKSIPYIAIPALIIVGREIAVSALREWMSSIGKRASVAVTFFGKVKTFIQMVSITLLLLHNPLNSSIFGVIGHILLYVAAILTLCSMFVYLRMAWWSFKDNRTIV